ncbi:hypothetical protein Tco_0726863 [Tanacetum coccineum]|uniref:Gag-Pol polyprotein n=1 Tax=Tanacetum coccineum TaxID=301880 RepID=A0ABQ4YHQ2_9ASTR
MEWDNIHPLQISINTKFLNSLQPEWRKYVTMTRQNANVKSTDFDNLLDSMSQYEPHVIASRAKKAARNHDPLDLVAHSNVHSSHSYASPSYSYLPQPYYVTHPSSVIDYEEDYQGNQAVIQDGRVDIQSKNVGYARNGNRNTGRSNNNQIATARNEIVQQIEANDQII